MATYKIVNITSSLGKRDPNYNSIQYVEYIDGMTKKSIEIKPNEVLFFVSRVLPISAQKLKVKKLITVLEVSEKEINSNSKNKVFNSANISVMAQKTNENIVSVDNDDSIKKVKSKKIEQ
jgi:hypothetical protein